MIMMLRVVALGAAATFALSLAGCSSSGRRSTASTPAAAPAQTTSHSSSAPADATVTAAVRSAYVTFFGYRSTSAQVAAALQHGSSFAQVIAAQATSSYAQKSAGTVSSVRMVSNDVAAVVFSVSNNGSTLLPDAHGYAVRENGTWKVAAKTFCALMVLEGTKAPACTNPSVTALPAG